MTYQTKDFSRSTLNTLAKRGIRIIGITVIPDMTKALPYASGERGYQIDDNGTGRVWAYADVVAAHTAILGTL